jgi:hypothetical protein
MTINDPLVHELSMEDYMAAATGLHWTPGYYAILAKAAKNWLSDHEGWGPRPTVDSVVIRSWKPDEILAYLRECGIEVTDD